MVLTDLKEVCPLLEKNAKDAGRRGKGAMVRIRPLEWGSIPDGEAVLNDTQKLGGVTHVVCSDVVRLDSCGYALGSEREGFLKHSYIFQVYFPPLIPLLLRTLLQLTSNDPVEDIPSPPVEVIISCKLWINCAFSRPRSYT